MRRFIEPYGEHPRQFGEWFIPDAERPPLVIVIHGGYWRPVWRLDLEEATSLDLAAHGFAVWSIEYRTYEFPWPTTTSDVLLAVDQGLADAARHGIDPKVLLKVGAPGELIAKTAASGKFDLGVDQLLLAKSEVPVMNDLKKEIIYALGDTFEKMGKAKEAVDEYKIIYMADSGYRDVAKKINDFYERQKGASA